MLSRQDDESILLMFSPIPRIDWSTGRGKRVNHAETIQGQAFGSPQDRSETIAAGLRPFTNGLAAARVKRSRLSQKTDIPRFQ